MIKIFHKNNILKVVLAFAIYISYLLCFYMYDATKGPDYLHYSNYLNYFFGIEDKSLRHSGTLYFYLYSLILSTYQKKIISTNFSYIQSEALIITNHILFIIGLIGLYKYFQSKKFEESKILISLIVLNFAPFIFQLKLSLKPEIIGFALFPWAIFSLSNYFSKKKFNDLILFLTSFSLILTSKASIALMISLFFVLIFYKEVFKENNMKSVLLIISSLTIIVCFVYIENFQNNGIHIYDNVSYHPVNDYAFRPNLKFFFSFNVIEFLKYPHIYFGKASSIFRIIILDSFNDYFHVWWNYDKSLFNNFTIYENWFDNLIFNQILNHQLEYYISTLLFIIYVYGLFYFRKYDKFILYSPLIGLLVLVINSMGFPSLNFNPLKADLFKTIYYSFFVSFSFTYLLVLYFSKLKKEKIFLVLIMFFVSFSFIYGFPKELDSQKKLIEAKTNISTFCKINKYFINSTSNCEELIINLPCGDLQAYVFPDKRTNFEDSNFTFAVDDRFKTAILLKDSDKLIVRGYAECYYYLNNGYTSPYSSSNLKIPILNIFTFIIFLFSASVFIYQKKKQFLN